MASNIKNIKFVCLLFSLSVLLSFTGTVLSQAQEPSFSVSVVGDFTLTLDPSNTDVAFFCIPPHDAGVVRGDFGLYFVGKTGQVTIDFYPDGTEMVSAGNYNMEAAGLVQFLPAVRLETFIRTADVAANGDEIAYALNSGSGSIGIDSNGTNYRGNFQFSGTVNPIGLPSGGGQPYNVVGGTQKTITVQGSFNDVTLKPCNNHNSTGSAAINTPSSPTSVCPGSPLSRMSVGIHGRVTFTDGTTTRLRSEPSTSAKKILDMPEGQEFDVIDGAECNAGYAWWQLRLPDGTTGWAAEGNSEKYFIEPLPQKDFAPQTSEKLMVGNQIVNNFYIGDVYTSPDGDSIIEENLEYQIAYHAKDQHFTLSLFWPDEGKLAGVQQTAENYFLTRLGITQEIACRLNVEVQELDNGSPLNIVRESGLSFCDKQSQQPAPITTVELPLTLSDACTAVTSSTLNANSLPMAANCINSIFEDELTKEESFELAQLVYDCEINNATELIEFFSWIETGISVKDAIPISFTAENSASCIDQASSTISLILSHYIPSR